MHLSCHLGLHKWDEKLLWRYCMRCPKRQIVLVSRDLKQQLGWKDK